MKTSRLAQAPRTSVQVLLCSVWMLLLVLVPVVHHHPAQAGGSPIGASEQYCTLCVVHSSITIDTGIPSIGPLSSLAEPVAPSTAQAVAFRAATYVEDRAPPALSH